MFSRLSLTLLTFCLCFFPLTESEAAEIKFLPGEEIDVILVKGEIVSGDEEKFSKIALQAGTGLVILSSPGGALLPALEIGKVIQIKGFATYVPANTSCVSACALLWVAGEKRLLSSSARVGFHASYRDNNGKLEEAGTANALVGRYLTLLNLSERAIIFATSASPYEVLWLTPTVAAEVGMPFSTMDLDGENPASNTASAEPPAPPPIRLAPSRPPTSNTQDQEPAGWYFATESKGTKWYIRGEDVMAGRATSRKAQMWVKTDDSQNKDVDFRSSMGRYTVDCVAMSYERTFLIFYDANGNSLETNTAVHREVIVPESIFDTLASLVCTDNHPGEDERDIP